MTEYHHATASSYKKIIEYFHPGFLLGITATPERMDNEDVFALFDKNVPYELRLRDAIINDLVVPFHYYGIRDKLVDYKSKDNTKISREIAKTVNVEFICSEIERHKPHGKLKAIAFCTTIAHASLMSEGFNEMGYNAVALTGKNDLGVRIKAFNDLQDDNKELEIICTVDILNEGVDIPQVNMVLFLRPTESQTIFLQQLGRGLRKYEGKEYVTVLDFIGNN
ncbi:MAG: DEAD/DEAH box helicase, partial [Anaeroplasmataceae bacterium]